jgi:hypothetical protein
MSYILNFFSDKSNHYKIYDNYLKMNKTNDQTLYKKSTASTIKIRREYIV